METRFDEAQLKDPAMQEVNSILRTCVHCGLCTATCPTYVLLGDERDSPRGRIYLMKKMFEGGHDATPEVRTHIDRCLSCLSCMTTCPSGVDYMHLVDMARVHIEKTSTRPLKDRLIRRMLAMIVPYPGRFRLAIMAARIGRPLGALFRSVGLKEMAAMLDLAPRTRTEGRKMPASGIVKAARSRTRGRVIMLRGCAQTVLRPAINDATLRLLSGQGIEVVMPVGEGCCGALVHHMGREDDAFIAAKRNIDAWEQAMAQGPVDAIIINASGCGTMVKDYAHLLKHDPEYAERAARMAELAVDISEYLRRIEMDAPKAWTDIRVAYHSACSMQHGQRITSEPRELLREAGYSVLEIPEGHLCCGSAGTYNMLQPEISGMLKERKLANIMRKSPDCVATGNIGCLTQLASAGQVPVVHTVELLDWAHGGPCPAEIAHLRHRRREVRSLFATELSVSQA